MTGSDSESCAASDDTDADGRPALRTAYRTERYGAPQMPRPSDTPPRRRARVGILVAAMVLAGVGAVVAEEASEESPDPDRVFIFSGRGFGHGVGLSQWGARQAAQEGLSAEAILKHYYSGVDITSRPASDIRVKLVEDVAEVALHHDGPWHITHDGTVTVTRAPTYRVTREGNAIVATPTTQSASIRSENALEFRAAGAPIGVDGRSYRGTIRVLPTSTGLDIVNTVPVEQYVRSVVSREMSPEWAEDAAEALRAQAIVARTYALANRTPSRDFDVMDDQRSQVYGGVTDEDPRSDAAVTATRGQVVTAGGELITAYYSASSGGHTEDGDRVFPADKPQPYLRGVPDPYDESAPLHRWGSPPVFTPDELSEKLRTVVPIRGIEILERGSSPRVFRARVDVVPFGGVILTGAQIRARLDLPDTWFDVVVRPSKPDGSPVALADDADRASVWLAVLNGGNQQGAAARLAQTAEDRGYRAVAAGNATERSEPTAVYAAPGSEAAAARVAQDLEIDGSVRPLSEAGDIPDAPSAANVVVIIGGAVA